jgi:hypothetical protein
MAAVAEFRRLLRNVGVSYDGSVGSDTSFDRAMARVWHWLNKQVQESGDIGCGIDTISALVAQIGQYLSHWSSGGHSRAQKKTRCLTTGCNESR